MWERREGPRKRGNKGINREKKEDSQVPNLFPTRWKGSSPSPPCRSAKRANHPPFFPFFPFFHFFHHPTSPTSLPSSPSFMHTATGGGGGSYFVSSKNSLSVTPLSCEFHDVELGVTYEVNQYLLFINLRFH